jgi:S1-C subfamily serine protease
MRTALVLGALLGIAVHAAAEDRFPTPEDQRRSFSPHEDLVIDGVRAGAWLDAHVVFLLTEVKTVARHDGGASVQNGGFACAAPLSDDGYMLTVRHAVTEPMMALRTREHRPELKPVRVVWAGQASACDVAVLKVEWSGGETCAWAGHESAAPEAGVFSAGAWLAEDDAHQWFQHDRAAGAVSDAPIAHPASGDEPAYALFDALLPVHPGDSGGPVVTRDGKLLGVTTAHLLDPRTGESTGRSRVIRPDTAFLDALIARDRAERAAPHAAGIAAAALATVIEM